MSSYGTVAAVKTLEGVFHLLNTSSPPRPGRKGLPDTFGSPHHYLGTYYNLQKTRIFLTTAYNMTVNGQWRGKGGKTDIH